MYCRSARRRFALSEILRINPVSRAQVLPSSIPSKTENSSEAEKDYEFQFIGYAQGFDRFGKKNEGLAKKALELAGQAETVVFFAGLDEVREAEGLDRENLKLPENQLSLLKRIYELKKKVVVVLFCGSAVELDVVNDADALVHAYLGGQAGVTAILNVLTGKVNPSAKLSESYPVRYEDCSSASHFPGKQMTVEYREGIFVGYRYYATANIPVAYPFGHGLSYTTYEYSDLKADDKGVTFTITNTGKMDGMEVAQLYISKPDSEIFRPAIELKGFKKVLVKAGESVTVTIPFDKRTFRNYNPKANEWQIEGGEYEIKIGASSADMRLKAKINVKGNATDFGYDKEKLASYYSGEVADVDDKQFELLLGRPIPNSGYHFYKKNRMVIHENCTVDDLRYSRRWVGRLFGGAINFAIWFFPCNRQQDDGKYAHHGYASSADQRSCEIRRNVPPSDGSSHYDV